MGDSRLKPLVLSEDERRTLENWVRRRSTAQGLALRADTDRDRVLTAQAALDYGIVDQVLGQRRLDDQAASPAA